MIDSLFHITHRANLVGILRNGLLCRLKICSRAWAMWIR